MARDGRAVGRRGDELFAGYERFAAGLAARRYAALRGRCGAPERRRSTASRRPPSAEGRSAPSDSHVWPSRGLPDAYRSWISFVRTTSARRCWTVAGRLGARGLPRDLASLWGAHPLDRLLDLNLRTYLLDDLLVKADRMSMAHGLEVRSPFLDTELLSFAARLPPRLKIRGLTLKRVLKAAVEDLLPREILHRAKRGFGVPLDRWFREDLHDYVAGTLGASDARVKRAPRPGVVDRLIAEHNAGTAITGTRSGRS